MRSSRISCLLQEAWLDLPKVRMHRGIKPIEMLVQAQSVAYLAALDDSLVHRRSEATALLAHLSLLAWSATMRGDVSGCLLTFTDARFSKLSSLPRLVLMGCVNKRSKPQKDCLIQEMTILRNLRCPIFRSPARRSNVSLLITLFDCEDPGAFSGVLFLPLSNNGLELRVCLEDLEGRTIR